MHSDLSDQYRPGDSLIHRLDPRVKVIGAVIFILAASLTPAGGWLGFAALLVLIVFLAYATRLGWTFALRRSFVALPFVLAALPVPFTTPGPEWWRIPVLGWSMTAPGVIRFLSILIRTGLAVQAAVLLTGTTRFPDLVWALGALRLPRSLVATIAFMYRYLFVLADESLRMLRARAARSASRPGARRPSAVWQARVAGGMVGGLFLRALERSERVYAAMVSRGYDGQVRTIHRFRWTNLDGWSLGLLAALAGLAVLAGHQG